MPSDGPTSCAVHGESPYAWACPECFVELRDKNRRLRAELEEARDEIDRLKAEFPHLIKYFGHRSGPDGMCELLKHSDYLCTCGLDKLLNRIHHAQEFQRVIRPPAPVDTEGEMKEGGE